MAGECKHGKLNGWGCADCAAELRAAQEKAAKQEAQKKEKKEKK